MEIKYICMYKLTANMIQCNYSHETLKPSIYWIFIQNLAAAVQSQAWKKLSQFTSYES